MNNSYIAAQNRSREAAAAYVIGYNDGRQRLPKSMDFIPLTKGVEIKACCCDAYLNGYYAGKLWRAKQDYANAMRFYDKN